MAPLLWHHIAKDEDVAPARAWAAVPVGKATRSGNTPGIWDLRDESVIRWYSYTVPLTGTCLVDWRAKTYPCYGIVLMFVDAHGCAWVPMVFSGGLESERTMLKKEGADDKAFQCYPAILAVVHQRSSVAMLEAHRQTSGEQGITQKAL